MDAVLVSVGRALEGAGAVLCITSVYGPFPPEYCEHHQMNNDMPMWTGMRSCQCNLGTQKLKKDQL